MEKDPRTHKIIIDEAQIINSLKSSRHHIGLLINFGESSLIFKRFIYG